MRTFLFILIAALLALQLSGCTAIGLGNGKGLSTLDRERYSALSDICG